MKLWSAIHTNLVMALNLIYPDKIINFRHDSFVLVTTAVYTIHVSTTPTSAILSITNHKKLIRSPYTGNRIATLTTIVFNDETESIPHTVKNILIRIKPLLDEK